MKKKLFTYLGLSILSLFVGFTQVKAESNVFNMIDFYDDYYINSVVSQSDIDILVNYYTQNYASSYSNYIIYVHDTLINPDFYYLTLVPTNCDTINVYYANKNSFILSSTCDTHTGVTLRSDTHTPTTEYSGNAMTSGMFLLTSTDFTFNGYMNTDHEIDKLVIPSYENTNLDVSYPSYELYVGDVIPTYDTLSSGSYDTYTTINVNDYAYVVLSLKNYEQDTFWTNIYTQGRLCLTPVYNYGMTQKQDIITGSINQGCTTSYQSLTPVNVSILQADIDNHAVYYISAYDNETTTIKVDNRVFDISYISQANANNPSVLISGRSYPVIPYSQLTDTATISTENNYISGQVCNPGDINCASTITGLDIFDLFTQPLQLFKTIGSSITSVLGVITAFIMFLPPTLQAFLYTAFFLVIILGIVKVLL